jgi:hypothetical protein
MNPRVDFTMPWRKSLAINVPTHHSLQKDIINPTQRALSAYTKSFMIIFNYIWIPIRTNPKRKVGRRKARLNLFIKTSHQSKVG